MLKLQDFDVAIESFGGNHRIRVSSSAGEVSADFQVPFTQQELEIFILNVVGSIGRIHRKVRRLESLERELLEDFGTQLFQAAFPGVIREFLDRSLLMAESKGAGLRIRLRLPLSLSSIPWEYLYDEEYGFLGLSPEIALVRYVEMPRPVRPFSIHPPLRVLTMISAPGDVPVLEHDEEWNKLNGALSELVQRGMVQVDRLEAGTLSALQRPMRLHEYHVLHFVGHGGFDKDAQDGALALEGTDRKTRLVTGRDLGLMVRGHRSLRLVVLNACEGARTSRDDPFGGVAQTLVRQGIPAVIAMQFEISDPAALVFSQSFYQAIGDGLPVDVAVVEARRTMFAEGHEVEWATPVLYLRSPDGRVFMGGSPPEPARKSRGKTGRPATISDVTEGTAWKPATNIGKFPFEHKLTPEEIAGEIEVLNELAQRLAALPVSARSILALVVSRGDVAGGRSREPGVSIPVPLLEQIANCSREKLRDQISILTHADLLVYDEGFIDEEPQFIATNSSRSLGWGIFADLHNIANGDPAIVRQVLVDLDFTTSDS